MKSYKKLIFPLLSIAACASIGVAGTYALFTSNNETNIAITSGKVNVTATLDDVELYSPALINLDGTVADATNAATATKFFNGGTASINSGVLSLSNMTPGDRASFKVNIKNNSNVDIKYRVIYSDVTSYVGTETYKLIDKLEVKNNSEQLYADYVVVDWTKTSGDDIDPLNISVELPTTVGNDYSNLSCAIRFSVEAVQANAYTEKTNCTVNLNIEKGERTVNATRSEFVVSKDAELAFTVVDCTKTNLEIKIEDLNKHQLFSVLSYTYDSGLNEVMKFTLDGSSFEFLTNERSAIGDCETFIITTDSTIGISFNECCVLEGTPIAMGDFTYKNVEDLMPGDEILAYDFFEGKFVSKEINYAFAEHGFANIYKVNFDNGTSVTVVNREDMFDVNLKQFFTVDFSTYNSLVGKEVLVNNCGNNDTAKIIGVEYDFRETTYYTLYSKELMNYVANDVLMIYSVSGFSQKYTVTDELIIDMDVYNADVEMYGLFTYEDFPDLTKEMFDDFDMATVTFLLGKGFITENEFQYYNDQFIREYNSKKPLFLAK